MAAQRRTAGGGQRPAGGVALDLLQMAKPVGPQYEATEHEDLSGEENLTLDRIIVDD